MPNKRLNYFNNQFLVAQDFIDEQNYHLTKGREHNRLLHSYGIAEGLKVVKVNNQTIKITQGTGIDNRGREIVLSADETGIVPSIPGGGGDVIVPSIPGGGGDVYVTIAYSQTLTDPQPANNPIGQTRITEQPIIAVTATVPPTDGTVIPLARFTLAGGNVPGNVNDEFDGGVRRMAGPFLPDNAVTNTKIADNAVNAAKIQDGTVGTNELADNAVTNAKIANDAVNAAKIQDGAVGTNELANNAVTNAKIADNAVNTAKIQDGQVATSKLADSAVTNAKIADNAVNAAKIQDGQVGTSELADSAVTNAKIAINSVSLAQLRTGTGIVSGTIAVPGTPPYSVRNGSITLLIETTANVDAFYLISCRVIGPTSGTHAVIWYQRSQISNGNTYQQYLVVENPGQITVTVQYTIYRLLTT